MTQNNRIHLVKHSIRERENYCLDQSEYRIKLNQNESPYPLPAELQQMITEEWKKAEWNRYPDVYSEQLRAVMAEVLDLSPEHIVTANGSNEILRTVFSSLLGPGRTMLTVAPSFSLYSFYGNAFGAKVNILPLQEDFSFPVGKIIEQCRDRGTVLTVLCSPNNPTGNTIDFSDVFRILEAASGYVLIDEAYIDFCDQDFSGLSRQFDNLIVIRTFSKAFSFALGRFGYGIASADLVEQLYKIIPPYNLNGFIQYAAGVLFQNKDVIYPVIESIMSERNRMQSILSRIPDLRDYHSEANFILVHLLRNCEQMKKRLQSEGVRIRDVSSYSGLSDHIRVTVGTPEENEEVVRILSKGKMEKRRRENGGTGNRKGKRKKEQGKRIKT